MQMHAEQTMGTAVCVEVSVLRADGSTALSSKSPGPFGSRSDHD